MLTRLFIGKDINQAKNTFVWTALSGIVYSLQSLIFLIILTNLMGKSAAGLYSLGIMIANQMLTVGKYSVRNYQVSDINEKYTFDQYYTFRICTCAAAMLITIGWVIFGGYRGDEAVVIISLTVYKMAECMSDLFEGLYQQRFRFDISGRSQFTKDFIMIICYGGMLIITKDVVLSSVVLAVVSFVLIFVIDFPIAGKFAAIKWNFRWKVTKELFFACTALFVSSFLFIYIHNAPKYALTRISGNDTSILAEFNALFMPVFVVDLFAGFTMRMWLTRMAVYHNDGDCGSFKKTINKQFGVITGLTVLSMAGMFFLGGPVLTAIYGIDLYGHEWTNLLLMLSGGLVAVYTLYENVIIIYRKQNISIVINVVTAVVAAVIVTPLASWKGIYGATVGYVIANAVRAGGYYIVAKIFMIKGRKKV